MSVRRAADLLDLNMRPILVEASKVTPRELDPVWDGVLWAGKPTLLAGDPGLGKSMLTCDLAARVTTGDPWPCSDERRRPADVIMLSAEDDPEDTIVPRLMAAGADLNRVAFIRGIREETEDGLKDHALRLDRHMDAIAAALVLRKTVRLIIIDPIAAYLGREIESHNDADVRGVMAGLAELAALHRASILFVKHLRKSDSATALYRIMGSLAFIAAARAGYCVVQDPDDEDVRLFLCAKNNLGPDGGGFRYVIRVNDDGIPYIAWGEERETRKLNEIFSAATAREAGKDDRVQATIAWLEQRLSHGPMPAAVMKREAEELGHSERALREAKRRLKVRAEILGFQGHWHWRLP